MHNMSRRLIIITDKFKKRYKATKIQGCTAKPAQKFSEETIMHFVMLSF